MFAFLRQHLLLFVRLPLCDLHINARDCAATSWMEIGQKNLSEKLNFSTQKEFLECVS